MAQYIRKGGVQMAFYLDIWSIAGWTVGLSRQRLSPGPADINNLTGIAFQENLSYEFGVGV